jgi:hypothetical protein
MTKFKMSKRNEGLGNLNFENWDFGFARPVKYEG